MALLVPSAWSSFDRWHNEINQLLQNRFSVSDGDARTNGNKWLPPVDITEEAERYVIQADIPGVAPDAIEITTDNGVLTLQGNRQEVRTENTAGVSRAERVSGSFYRSFTLPDGVDVERIVARGAHGVLEISIPKVTKVQPRRIEVVH